jgi:DNA mismatch repair protein MutS
LPLFSVELKRQAPKLVQGKDSGLLAAMSTINPDEMTPREALEALYRLKGLVANTTS